MRERATPRRMMMCLVCGRLWVVTSGLSLRVTGGAGFLASDAACAGLYCSSVAPYRPRRANLYLRSCVFSIIRSSCFACNHSSMMRAWLRDINRFLRHPSLCPRFLFFCYLCPRCLSPRRACIAQSYYRPMGACSRARHQCIALCLREGRSRREGAASLEWLERRFAGRWRVNAYT